MSTKITMSLVLASMLSMGITGCGSSSDDNSAAPVAAPTATDITVERGKVYDANVTDSSTPAQVAIEKANQNVYTFAKAPTYPVVVNGGWIDVNDDGVMDTSDVKLDIEMKSYSTTITPITTFIADRNETVRKNKLNALVARLNESGVGSAQEITAEDLLKVPSQAPRDVFVTANAIYKDMKENSNALPDENAILTQFGTIDASLDADATAKDFEVQVVGDLETGGNVEKVSNQDIFEFAQKQPDAIVPTLAQALLLNNISDFSFLDWYTFNADYTLTDGAHIAKWSVSGKTLTIIADSGDIFDFVFTNETPVNGETVTESMSYINDSGVKVLLDGPTTFTIKISTPIVVTPPTGGGDTTGDGDTTGGTTLPTLDGYSSIIIYKNIAQTTADELLNAYSANAGFDSSNVAASCTDFGFTSDDKSSEISAAGITTRTYSIINMTTYSTRTCTEADYTGAPVVGGSANILAYYGN